MTDSDWLARQGWQPADLEANRIGRLSPAQVERLRGLMRRYLRRALWWTLPIFTIALGAAIAFLVATGSGALFVFPVMTGLASAPLVGYVASRTSAANSDLDSGGVGIVAGKIDGFFFNWRTGSARIRIGTTRMDSIGPRSDQIWTEPRKFVTDAMRNGRAVQAYYLPESRLLVAAEPYSIQ